MKKAVFFLLRKSKVMRTSESALIPVHASAALGLAMGKQGELVGPWDPWSAGIGWWNPWEHLTVGSNGSRPATSAPAMLWVSPRGETRAK